MTTFGAQGLTKGYAGAGVLDSVTFTTTPGRAFVVKGANGAGKTTLLRCLNGTTRPDAGQVLLDGAPCDPADRHAWEQIYGVLDDFTWFPGLTVADHLAMLDPHADAQRVLGRFGVAQLADRVATSLSTGQMRRAALATTLVRPWQVLLLDEPEQRLDDDGLERLVAELRAFLDEGRCVVLSTHADALVASLDAEQLRLG